MRSKLVICIRLIQFVVVLLFFGLLARRWWCGFRVHGTEDPSIQPVEKVIGLVPVTGLNEVLNDLHKYLGVNQA